MKKLEFRRLRADEIECRVGTEDRNGHKWCTLLLYKDARVDMRLLDEVVGPMGWQREHIIRENIINGVITKTNYCRVSIYNDATNQWVLKEDIGTESNTENAKGEASDAFKRACFNWGIGRELYSAPFIFINLGDGDLNKNGKISQSFCVKSIGYDDDGNITSLEIVDKNGNVRYSLGKKAQAVNEASKAEDAKAKYDKQINALVAMVQTCNTYEELMSLKEQNASFAQDQKFRDALNTRYAQIKNAA